MQFLTTFTVSLMKSLDIRSEPAVRLLAEFLDMDSGGTRVNAEHFAHGEFDFSLPFSTSYRLGCITAQLRSARYLQFLPAAC